MKTIVRKLPCFRSTSVSKQSGFQRYVPRVVSEAASRTSCNCIGKELLFDARNASSQKFKDVIADEELQKFEKELLGSARCVNRTVIEAGAIAICAGAGMGVDSGLPDFRGNEGFWKAYPPLKKLNIEFQEMANPHHFSQDPSLAWGFYGHRLHLYRKVTPHEGFNILREFSKTKEKGCTFVFTSNVDGQFQKAGFADDQIVECHGSIHHIQCIQPSKCKEAKPTVKLADSIKVAVNMDTLKAKESTIPRCPVKNCNQIARPNILMFNDWDWIADRTMEQEQKFLTWEEQMFRAGKKLAVFDIGAGPGTTFEILQVSSDRNLCPAIPTVRSCAERLAHEYNGTLIRINIRNPEIPFGLNGFSLPIGAKSALTAIHNVLANKLVESDAIPDELLQVSSDGKPT